MKRVLFVGLGDLGSQILDMFLAYVPGDHEFFVGGRNIQSLQKRVNLSIFAAMQLGKYPKVQCIPLDLDQVAQTAEVIEHLHPDIIFNAATLLPWRAINILPQNISQHLSQAQMGPWLPVHLLPVLNLMKATKLAGQAPQVINATYPDVVNYVLGKVGLAPMTGIGDLANNIPALRKSIAFSLDRPVEQIDVRLFMQRYLSYRISRVGNTGGAPFHLEVLFDGEENVSHLLDLETVLALLPTNFRRAPGQYMTASSATVIFNSIVNDLQNVAHVPGPNGLPGGYPVTVSREGIEILLPEDMSLEQVIQINKGCMRFDGIENVDEDGTVSFTERESAILTESLGYSCQRLALSEVVDRAEELQAKYMQTSNQYHRL